MTVSITIVLTPQITTTTPPTAPSWYSCAFPSPRAKVTTREMSSCGVWRGGPAIVREGMRRANGAGARGARRSVTTPDSLVGRAAAILLIAIIPPHSLFRPAACELL